LRPIQWIFVPLCPTPFPGTGRTTGPPPPRFPSVGIPWDSSCRNRSFSDPMPLSFFPLRPPAFVWASKHSPPLPPSFRSLPHPHSAGFLSSVSVSPFLLPFKFFLGCGIVKGFSGRRIPFRPDLHPFPPTQFFFFFDFCTFF